MGKLVVGVNDLATVHPELLKEWDFEKNGELKPESVTSGSNKKVWWKCKRCGHEWQAYINNRSKGHGCPKCGRHDASKSLLLPKDGNSLQDKFSFLIDEWNYEKNNELKPNMVNYGSKRKVWWKCKRCGYEWQAQICNRTSDNATGCPNCSSIYSTSLSEQAIYWVLKQYFPGALNRVKLKDEKGKIEVDVLLSNINVAVEYDGIYWHQNKKDIDKNKEKRLNALKIKLYRIIESNGNKVIGNCIYYDYRNEWFDNLSWAIKILLEKLGFGNIFANIKVYEQDIKELYYKTVRDKSLAVVFPNLAKEWHPVKNGKITPFNVLPKSNIKVWWKCEKGHEWEATISSRSAGRGCPYCSGRFAIKGVNDLFSKRPELLQEWDYVKNNRFNPEKFVCGSEQKVWWKCKKCGYEWQSTIYNRAVRNYGCPACSNQVVWVGHNDLSFLYPNLVNEWNFDKNDSNPSDFVCGSEKKVWWKCEKCGYEWLARINSRVRGNGCPECAKNKRKKKGK